MPVVNTACVTCQLMWCVAVCVCVCHVTYVDVPQDIAISSMSRYVSPINPAVFPHLSVVLLSIGIFFMAWFFVYPLTGSVHLAVKMC